MNKNTILKILLAGFLPVFVLSAQVAARAAAPEKTIEADGAAAGEGDRARQTAINRALRAAVEQGVGTFIDSSTMVENFQLVEDRILSEVKGYVKSYEVLSDNGGAEGVWRVRVRALVALAVLESDLKALNIIREMKNNPRFMVIARESVDGFERTPSAVRSAIEKKFLAKSFRLVDADQMKMVRERDAALNFEDPAKAASLGKRYGAEILILVEASADFMDKSKAYGVSVYAYSANVSARAIKTDIAQVVASESAEATGRDGGKTLAAKNALGEAGDTVADGLLAAVVENMRSEAFNDVDVEIVVHNISVRGKNAMEKSLGAIDGVVSVYERSYIEGNLVIDVKIAGSLFGSFEEALESIDEMQVRVTKKTQNRIDCEVVELMEG